MKRFCQALAVVLTAAVAATAADAPATNNATVQPAGPRSGTNGKKFCNIEGRGVPSSDQFASYGVIEFNSADLQLGQVTHVTALKLILVQDLASFSSRGLQHLYVTEDLTTSIEPLSPPECFFDLSDVHGLGNQFQPLHDLGTGQFDIVRTTWVDPYTFNVQAGSALETYLKNQINSGGTIRVIVAPEFSDQDDELVAGTFGGYTSTTGTQPYLNVTAN
jgi:hypothetical protein